MNRFALSSLLTCLLFLLIASSATKAQPTYFNYQATLTDKGQPANGAYDFEFELFDALEGGSPVGSPISIDGVQVTDGSFSVSLDFGDVYPGEERFLEIRVQASAPLKGEGKSLTSHTTLAPRQKIGIAPYAIKSKSAQSSTTADQLGGIDASQYLRTLIADNRYVRIFSRADSEQPGSSFNVGEGKVGGVLEAGSLQSGSIQTGSITSIGNITTTGSYFIGTTPVISMPANDIFIGSADGSDTVTIPGTLSLNNGLPSGDSNYIQNSTDLQSLSNFNIAGKGAADVLEATTQINLGGHRVLFVGPENLTQPDGDSDNLFLGRDAGSQNTAGGLEGTGNTFLGRSAGRLNMQGFFNSFFGAFAGEYNQAGEKGVMVGYNAGKEVSGGLENVYIGYESALNPSGGGGNWNTFVGTRTGALVSGESNSFFGAYAGESSGGVGNSFFGFRSGSGTNSSQGNTFIGAFAGDNNGNGDNNSVFGRSADVGSSNLSFATAIGSEAVVSSSNTIALGRADGSDTVLIPGNISLGGVFLGDVAFINNSTSLQSNSNFNISGTGKANVLDISSRVDFAGQTLLSLVGGIPNGNLSFGINSGHGILGGVGNSFFGTGSGNSTNGGFWNAFVGLESGFANTTGAANTFIGRRAGFATTTGVENTFVGAVAGAANVDGSDNSAFGRGADVGSGSLTHATAIGSEAIVTSSNTVQLGRNGLDHVRVGKLFAPGVTPLCLSATNEISSCSSSVRYKSNIETFTGADELLNLLRPVTFNWMGSSTLDLGLVAEEVAEIEPLLVTYSKDGNVEGVKYDRIGVVLVNVVKEQQRTIDQQQKVIEKQQDQIDALVEFVCASNKTARICTQ